MSIDEEVAALRRNLRFEEGEDFSHGLEGNVCAPGIQNREGMLYVTPLRVGVSAAAGIFTEFAQVFTEVNDVLSVESGVYRNNDGSECAMVVVRTTTGHLMTLSGGVPAQGQLAELAWSIQCAANRVIRADWIPEYQRLEQIMKQEDWARWWPGICALLENLPYAVPALLQAAIFSSGQGEYDTAIALYERALAAGALGAAEIHAEVASCLASKEDWVATLEAANNSLELEISPDALKWRGVARVETGDRHGGLADLRACVESNPKDDGAWWLLGTYGRLLVDVDAVASAVARLKQLGQTNKALDFEPWLLIRRGDFVGAMRVAEEAFGDGYVSTSLAMDYLSTIMDRSPKRALAWLPVIDKALFEDPNYRFVSAMICFAAEEFGAASDRVRQLELATPAHEALRDLIEAGAELRSGHPAQALQRLRNWAIDDAWSKDTEANVEAHQYVCVLAAAAASELEDVELTEQMLRRSEGGAPIDMKWIAAQQSELRNWTRSARVAEARSEAGPKVSPYAVLDRLVTELRRSGRLASLAETLDQERRTFDQPPLVAVMGEYSVGKSTFINAWLGKPLLPTGEGVTTGTITILRYGEQERMRAVFKDGRVVERDGLSSVADFVKETGTGSAAADLPRHVDVFLRAEVLRRISIVDSPGLNAPFVGHKEITQGYLAQADAIVWLFNVENAGKSSEGEFLAQLARHRRKAVAVVNQIDLVPKADADEVVADVRRDFAGTFAHALGVSSKRALDAGMKGDAALRERSGFPKLEALLEEDLLRAARRIKEEAALQKAAEVLGELTRARREYEAQTEKALASISAMREASRKTLEGSLGPARQQAFTNLRVRIGEIVRESAGALAQRSVADEVASAAAAEPIARGLAAGAVEAWSAFATSIHAPYDAMQKRVLDGCAGVAKDDWAASLRAALAELRAELASWRKDLTDDLDTVNGYMDGYLAAGGLRMAHAEAQRGARANADAVSRALATRFDFLHTQVGDATTSWIAAVQGGLAESLTRLERELRKSALDTREATFGTVERAAASLGLVAAAADA